jgi:hypothetical protein
MTRRRLLALSALAVACRRVPPDPLAAFEGAVPTALQDRMRQLAGLVADHDWDRVMTLFDEEHRTFQARIYFSPDYNEAPPDPDDPKEQAAFVEWYLLNTLGLFYVDNSLDRLNDIDRLEYLRVDRPFGDEGPREVHFTVHASRGRTRTGWVFADPDTHAFFGSSG